jgi:hypothetical protein
VDPDLEIRDFAFSVPKICWFITGCAPNQYLFDLFQPPACPPPTCLADCSTAGELDLASPRHALEGRSFMRHVSLRGYRHGPSRWESARRRTRLVRHKTLEPCQATSEAPANRTRLRVMVPWHPRRQRPPSSARHCPQETQSSPLRLPLPPRPRPAPS